MISINFLQIKTKKTFGSTWLKPLIAGFMLFVTLCTGTSAFAKVPEDFMNRPVVLFPTQGMIVPKDQFEIRGTAHNWAHVDIRIDGVYVGRATTARGRGSNATFVFKPTSISTGTHWIQAEVRSETEVFRSPLTTSVMVEVVEPTPAPTLLTFIGSGDYQRPYIRGVAVNNTNVSIYVDGKLDQTFEARGVGPTISFSVQPQHALSQGFHTVTAKSTNVSGVMSISSNQRVFLVEAAGMKAVNAPGLTGKPSTGPSNPKAPTLTLPQSGTVINAKQATIHGVSQNGLTIQAYVDGALKEEVPVTNHPSGTGSFSFNTGVLESGAHGVYATSRDEQGNVSSHSNELEFMIAPEGSVPVFNPNGETSRWFPQLPSTEDVQKKSSQPTESTKESQPTSQRGSVQGEATTTPVTPTTTPTSESDDPEATGTPARVIIGWIILGISVLGILAYIIAAILEHKQKKQHTEQPALTQKNTVNFTQSTTGQPNSSQTTKQPNDDLGLDDDIPKGYQ